MAAKSILLCAFALIIQTISGQCIGNPLNAGLAFPGNGLALGPNCANSLGLGNGVASSGGGFAVTSSSPIAPTGLTVSSDNVIEGPLAVGGELPFLGTAALEGAFPTAGAGAISYGCGNGAVGITSEGLGGPVAAGPAFGPGLPGPAFGLGPAGLGPAGLGPAALGYNGLAGPALGAGIGINGRGCGTVF